MPPKIGRSVFPPVSEVPKDTLQKLSNMNEEESNAFLLGLLGKCEKVGIKTNKRICIPIFPFYVTLCCVNNSTIHMLAMHCPFR